MFTSSLALMNLSVLSLHTSSIKIASYLLFPALAVTAALFFLLHLSRLRFRFLSSFFSMISCGSMLTLLMKPRASNGVVVKGPIWLTLSSKFSQAVNLREIAVPRVSKP